MRTLTTFLFICTSALTLGCDPSCTKVCKKLVECEDVDSPRLSWVECTESCEEQERLYEEWTDTQKREDFSSLKSCIASEECSDIADGECYDEDLYIW